MVTDARTCQQPGDRGFTLVEVLVAIVLVGVLSAVVVVGVSAMTGKGSSGACAASRDGASAATMSYFAKHRAFPTTITALVEGEQLELADGVTVPTPLTAAGSGWTLTMVSTGADARPTFTCS